VEDQTKLKRSWERNEREGAGACEHERERNRERECVWVPGHMCEGNEEGRSLLLAGEKMLALSPAGKQWLRTAYTHKLCKSVFFMWLLNFR